MSSSLFRGEIVVLNQIYFQSEVAYSCVSRLGEMGVVQFRDVTQFILEKKFYSSLFISFYIIHTLAQSFNERFSTQIRQRSKKMRRNGTKNK